MDSLEEKRSVDEELVAIVENNACGTDAVQVLTGCTFGKGNFIFKDYGKHAFTFMGRNSGKGVRVTMNPGGFKQDNRHQELMAKIREGKAIPSEQQEFQKLHRQKAIDVLDMPAEKLFTIKWIDKEPPSKAKVEPSIMCDKCGEPTMASKLEKVGEKRFCQECAKGDV